MVEQTEPMVVGPHGLAFSYSSEHHIVQAMGPQRGTASDPNLPISFQIGSIMSARIELLTQVICEEMFAKQRQSEDPFSATLLRLPHERPPMSQECRNPDVVAGSAELQMRIAIMVGLLSAATTGWWGGLSDRRGRTKVLACVCVSFLAFDFSYLAIGLLPITSLPFGSNFLLLPAALNGALGGLSTLLAAHQAYISDCTPAGTRAKVFARLAGFFYFGFIIGPAVGGWMVKATDSLVAPFLLATAGHVLYFFVALFVMPESTSAERRKTAMIEHQKETSLSQEEVDEQGQVRAKSKSLLLRFSAPLQPLALLLPRPVEQVERLQSRPASRMPSVNDLRRTTIPDPASSMLSISHISRSRKRDWNLFWLSLSYAIEISCMGILSLKSLYAINVFHWGATELGYFFTFISITRVLCLTVILPLVIKVWHRPPRAVSLPQDAGNDEQEPLLDDEGHSRRPSFAAGYGATGSTDRHVDFTETATPEQSGFTHIDPHDPQHEATLEELWTMRAKHLRLLHDSHFDLKLARVSLFINVVAYVVFSLFRGPTIFIIASAATSLGAGGGASMSSLALALLQKPSQAGKLFGAWGIASAIGSDVFGPVIFTWVFKRYVHTKPHAIFYAGAAFFLASFLCLCCIRLRKPQTLTALPPRPMSKHGGSTPTGAAGAAGAQKTSGSGSRSGSQPRQRDEVSPARRSTFLDEQ
jgi:MFS family permease